MIGNKQPQKTRTAVPPGVARGGREDPTEGCSAVRYLSVDSRIASLQPAPGVVLVDQVLGPGVALRTVVVGD